MPDEMKRYLIDFMLELSENSINGYLTNARYDELYEMWGDDVGIIMSDLIHNYLDVLHGAALSVEGFKWQKHQ